MSERNEERPRSHGEQDAADFETARELSAVGARHIDGPLVVFPEGRSIVVSGGPNNDDIAEFFYSDEATVKTTRAEALANAHLFAAAPRMLAHLKWFAENDGECLGDHPLMLAKIQAIIAEMETVR